MKIKKFTADPSLIQAKEINIHFQRGFYHQINL